MNKTLFKKDGRIKSIKALKTYLEAHQNGRISTNEILGIL